MGGYDFTCTECHKTYRHRIPGASTTVPATEGELSCTDCHSDKPHSRNNLLSAHLNKHCDTVACNTCHSPVYAKEQPTKTWWDWSKAGDKSRKGNLDENGMPDYHWKKGEMGWSINAKPDYAWYNGYSKQMMLGDKIDPKAPHINLTAPVGSILDSQARITPFKIMKGVQPVDSEYNYLLVPHLFPENKNDTSAYWKTTNWDKSLAYGMKKAGLDYSGKYKWVETWMYWRVNHEVLPAEYALKCNQCHTSLKSEQTCKRCHSDNRYKEYAPLAKKNPDFSYLEEKGYNTNYLKGSEYLNFKELGYKGDPIIHGGRFKNK